MNQETDAAHTEVKGAEGIQQGLADRAEALHAVNKARETLGKFAVNHEANADSHGVILTPREVEAVAHGETDSK